MQWWWARAAQACARRWSWREAGLQGRGAVQGVSRRARTRWRRRAASPLRSATGRGQLALAHVRHRQGVRLPRRPGCDRVHVPQGERGGGRARALRHAVRPAATTARSTSGRSAATSQNFGERAGATRSCAAADRTGHAMLHTLYQRNVRANTQFFVEWMALDLIRDADGRGARRHRAGDGNRRSHDLAGEGDAVRHRRGGAHLCFVSTNAFINTGDGLGMAARAGIPLEDMEFWQFHPTGVAGAGVLITEGRARRGRLSAEQERRALHGALCAQRQGPRQPRRGVARDGHRDQGRPRLRPGRPTTCC